MAPSRSSATPASEPVSGRFRRASPRVPANALPSITVSPPNSSAWAMPPSRWMPPSAMSGTRPPTAARHCDQRLDLRHAEVGGQPRRAAAARTDADLDAVDAALEQEPRAFGRRHVAGDRSRRRRAACAAARSRAPSRASGRARYRSRERRRRRAHLRGALEVVAGRADRRRRRAAGRARRAWQTDAAGA